MISLPFTIFHIVSVSPERNVHVICVDFILLTFSTLVCFMYWRTLTLFSLCLYSTKTLLKEKEASRPLQHRNILTGLIVGIYYYYSKKEIKKGLSSKKKKEKRGQIELINYRNRMAL